MPGLYDTYSLNRVVDTMKRTPAFLLNAFFGSVQQSDVEEIFFDVRVGKRRISPFVSPLQAGKLVEELGYSTNVFSPAYVKDKRVFNPEKPFRRRAGENIGGSMSPSARQAAALAEALSDQQEMLTRRMEVMAAEIVTTGAVTVSGEGFGTKVVDFQRAAGNTVSLSGGTAWGAAGVNPIEDIEDWSSMILQSEGAVGSDVIMDVAAWRLFKAGLKQASPEQNLNEILDIRRGNPNAVMDTVLAAELGAQYMGSDGKHRYWVYQDWYVDPADGTEKPVLPANTVVLAGSGIEGTRHFGAVRDEEAGFQARESFTKSWVVPDPSCRYLLMQSAPLLVPMRPNASLCATVA